MRDDLAAMGYLKAEVQGLQEIIENHLPTQIMEDRRRLKFLEEAFQPRARPKQKNDIDVLMTILVSQNGKWISEKDVRHKMNLTESAFSRLLTILGNRIQKKDDPTDRRKTLMRLI